MVLKRKASRKKIGIILLSYENVSNKNYMSYVFDCPKIFKDNNWDHFGKDRESCKNIQKEVGGLKLSERFQTLKFQAIHCHRLGQVSKSGYHESGDVQTSFLFLLALGRVQLS